jgi:transposase-like protein
MAAPDQSPKITDTLVTREPSIHGPRTRARDERVGEFLNRPLTGEWPYVWLDATYLKVRQGGRIVPVAIVAVAANTEGRREIIGLGIGTSEACGGAVVDRTPAFSALPFWTEFLRSLRARGLGGIRLVISDAHTGLKAAIASVLEATWQRCRVHWIRNALAHVSRGQHTVVAPAIRQAFDQPDRAHAGETWRKVAEQLRPRWPKLADLMDASQHDVLACTGLHPFLPQTVRRTVCRLQRAGANFHASTAPSCTARTRSND